MGSTHNVNLLLVSVGLPMVTPNLIAPRGCGGRVGRGQVVSAVTHILPSSPPPACRHPPAHLLSVPSPPPTPRIYFLCLFLRGSDVSTAPSHTEGR